ncbi:MAG: lectin [Hyphomicrobiales bacterium]|nr:lectin [Hyphomicrobiales bacterium]
MNNARTLGIFAAMLLSAGLGTSAQAQQPPPQSPNMTFFVTSAGPGKGGDLGGLEGADAHCQQLARSAGAGSKTWRAYLSTNAAAQGGPVNARDRIGRGPWQNFKGEVVAQNVDDLHSDNNKLGMQSSLTERGTIVAGVGYTPNYHDVLTGSSMDGRAFPGNLNLTCNNWTSGTFGSAMVGHIDRRGLSDNVFAKSWNASHMSRSCTQDDLRATGGNGLFYCFAQ